MRAQTIILERSVAVDVCCLSGMKFMFGKVARYLLLFLSALMIGACVYGAVLFILPEDPIGKADGYDCVRKDFP